MGIFDDIANTVNSFRQGVHDFATNELGFQSNTGPTNQVAPIRQILPRAIQQAPQQAQQIGNAGQYAASKIPTVNIQAPKFVQQTPVVGQLANFGTGLINSAVNAPKTLASKDATFLQNPSLRTGAGALGANINLASYVALPGMGLESGSLAPQLPKLLATSATKFAPTLSVGQGLQAYGEGKSALESLKEGAVSYPQNVAAGVALPVIGRFANNLFRMVVPEAQKGAAIADLVNKTTPVNTKYNELQGVLDSFNNTPANALNSIKGAVADFQSGKGDSVKANNVLNFATEKFLPQFKDESTLNKSQIWNYLMARKEGSFVNVVPAPLKQLDNVLTDSAYTNILRSEFEKRVGLQAKATGSIPEAQAAKDAQLPKQPEVNPQLRATENPSVSIPKQDSSSLTSLTPEVNNQAIQNDSKVLPQPLQGESQRIPEAGLNRPQLSSQQISEPGKTLQTSEPPPTSPELSYQVLAKGSNSPLADNIPQTQNMTKVEAKNIATNLGLQGRLKNIPTGEKDLGVVNTIGESNRTTPELKQNIEGQYTPVGNKEALSAAQQRIATDAPNAYQFALKNHSAEGNATAILLAKQYEANGQADLAANLMVQKAQQALEAGQGNQIYSMWDKLSPETIGQTAAKTIENYNATAKTKIPALTAEQYQSFVDAAKAIQGMGEGRDKNIATQALLTQLGSLIPSSVTDKGIALWRAGLLTGFRTPGKILISHALSNTAEQLKNIPASAVAGSVLFYLISFVLTHR